LAAARTYPVEIVRRLDPHDLAQPGEDELDRGEEDGLGDNQQYQDLRGASWDDVADALDREAALFERFEAAADLDAEAERLDEERANAVFPEDDLWGLDVGVIGATMALSALGATPVSSCNAGGFGGHHVARFPYVAFFATPHQAQLILAIAEDAAVGLDVIDAGIARLFGRTDVDLHRFGRAALRRFRGANG